MNINGSVALVTGASRGLGRAFAQRLIERGAARVYAAARRPETIDLPGATPMRLDVTDPAQIAAAAELARDVTLLVNNAGTQSYQRLVDGDLDAIRAELETILFGPLQLTRACAPHLARNGGGAILNVLSAMSWFGYDGGNGYFLAKAAGWAATNGLRLELAKQETQVTAVHIGVIDTDMAASWPGAKLDPIDVANIALDGVEAGAAEVLADDWSRTVKAYLQLDPVEAYQRISADLAAMATPAG